MSITEKFSKRKIFCSQNGDLIFLLKLLVTGINLDVDQIFWSFEAKEVRYFPNWETHIKS